MAKCDYCGTIIIMGGARLGEQRFCNKKCAQNAQVLAAAKSVPDGVLETKVQEIWGGKCPKCGKEGPVDLHKSYHVWSAIVTTRWSNKSHICCRPCAKLKQVSAAVSALLVGWWGFPWGLILTPVQITQNIRAMNGAPDPSQPSDALRKAVLVRLGGNAIAQQKAGKQSPAGT